MPFEVRYARRVGSARSPGSAVGRDPRPQRGGAHRRDGATFATALRREAIQFEILVVNDNSQDQTEAILRRLDDEIPELRHLNNAPPHGFGFAVRSGLAAFRGDAVAVVMADAVGPAGRPGALLPDDAGRLRLRFGTALGARGSGRRLPVDKRLLNRLGNAFIRLLSCAVQRRDQRVQALSPERHCRRPTAPGLPLQSHGGASR